MWAVGQGCLVRPMQVLDGNQGLSLLARGIFRQACGEYLVRTAHSGHRLSGNSLDPTPLATYLHLTEACGSFCTISLRPRAYCH